ncbi:Adaptin family protein [Klebsormidium nitens]|uniref:Adaptin family protein n=1 Tax=Klebsormidium nitens TaxID=105231 RepID=A0A1Y1IJS8_KLENI|nr:Adaptin family protein [Klebsormidium nitens]|eukprot:GAQ89669.1 Adaptin family protein [Klebsormidium nitens]
MAAALISAQVGWGSSKEFLDLVKQIGECRSKAEEDKIVLGEIELLKKKMAEPDVPKKKMKEYVIRLVYVEMLGHNASFGYIHAVKMTHEHSLAAKKTGYLATSLFLDDSHDLIILIVNTIQQDLKSDNYLVVCAALTAVCKLINAETIPAVLNQVAELLHHPKELVRRKAVMALHRFYQRSPSTVSHLMPRFRQVLCDKDPSVMSAALCGLYELIVADAAPYKNLVASFVSILKQVAEHRLPKTYDYHKTPAPFIQIKLLKILALLGVADKAASENMYSVLADVLRKSDTGATIGNAILYEGIATIAAIYPNPKLLQQSAQVTSRFLKSESHNLRYMGIDALGRIVKINADFAAEHQLAVIDCLEDPDETLKRKTLELLFKMTKPANVEVIVERMIGYMRTVTDAHSKGTIAGKVIELAERFAPTNEWFILTMNQVFALAGDLVKPKAAHDLMRLIAEGNGEEDEASDTQLRSLAVDSYLDLLEAPKLPALLLQVICWVLGEYGTADGKHSATAIVTSLCDLADRYSEDTTVRGYAVSAIQKVCAFQVAAGRPAPVTPEVRSFLDALCMSRSTDLQQRAYELQALLGLGTDAVGSALPEDASCEDIEVDESLSFLGAFVAAARTAGAKPYISENERLGLPPTTDLATLLGPSGPRPATPPSHSLRFEAYETPTIPARNMTPPEQPNYGAGDLMHVEAARGSAASGAPEASGRGQTGGPPKLGLRLDGVQKKWGRSTYTSAPSTSAASTSASSSSAPPSAPVSSAPREEARPTPYVSDRRPREPEVSEEKKKLAASLFGGGAATTSRGGGKAAPRPATKTKLAEGGRAGTPTKSTPVPQPEVNLLDFGSDSEAPSSAAPTPAADPFKQLEGLSVSTPAPPSTEPSPAVAAAAKPAFDLASLYAGPTQPGSVVGGVSSNRPTSPVPGLTNTGPGLAGNGRPNSVSPVVNKAQQAQKAGIVPQNPDIFHDLLG